jgi:hypothetical protein
MISDAMTLRGHGVDPTAVQVTAGEYDGDVRRDGVEQVAMRYVGPQAVAKAVSLQRQSERRWIRLQPLADQPYCLGRGLGARQVEPASRQRPLIEVHVAVPEAWQDPPAVQVDGVGGLVGVVVRIEYGAPAVTDEDVARLAGRHQAGRLQSSEGSQADR